MVASSPPRPVISFGEREDVEKIESVSARSEKAIVEESQENVGVVEQTDTKVATRRKKRTMSAETRRRISVRMTGRVCSEASRAKISAKMKGKAPWNKGRKMSLKTRKKMRDAKKGIEPWNRGRNLTDFHKASIAKALSRRYVDDDTRARMRAARRMPFDTLISAGMKKEKNDGEYGVLGGDVINEYVSLRRELREWSDRFTLRVRHRPNISDVRKAAPPRIIRKFEVYLDLKKQVRGLAREVIGTVNPNHIPVVPPVAGASQEPLVHESTTTEEEEHVEDLEPSTEEVKEQQTIKRKKGRASHKLVRTKLSPNDYRAIGKYRLMETVDIHQFVSLRKELRVWSNTFKQTHGRTPALSDVQALGDTVIYHKFCKYLDAKQKMSGLLSEVHNGKIDEDTITEVAARGKRILRMLRNGEAEDDTHPEAPTNVQVNDVLASTTISDTN